jgi:hypothetical protein
MEIVNNTKVKLKVRAAGLLENKNKFSIILSEVRSMFSSLNLRCSEAKGSSHCVPNCYDASIASKTQ